MRKLLHLLIIIAYCNFVYSQNYTLTPNPIIVEVDLDTLDDPIEVRAEAVILNNTSDTLHLQWERIINDKPDCWETTVFGVWVTVPPFIDSLSFELPPNQEGQLNVSAFIDLIGIGPTAGDAEVVLKLSNQDDASDTLRAKYQFTVIGENNCSTNISEVNDRSFIIYPNPATSTLWITLDNHSSYMNNSIQVHSMDGQLMNSVIIPEGQKTISFSLDGYTPGIYLVTLLNKDNFVAQSQRIIVVKE